MLDMSKIPSHQMHRLSFSTYTPDEILKMSVLEVTNPQSFDYLGHATSNGVYDPRFGPSEARDTCVTCGCASSVCIGHFGHIKLPVPTFNPIFIRIIFKLKALDRGLVNLAKDMEDVVKSITSTTKKLSKFDLLAVKDRLSSMLASAFEDVSESIVNSEDGLDSSSLVKSVIEYRNKIINEYLNHQINTVDCPTCNSGRRTMHLEQNTRVVVGPAVTPRQLARNAQKKRKAAKKSKEEDEEDDFLHRFGGAREQAEENADDPVVEGEVKETIGAKQVYLTPEEVRNHLLKVYETDGDVLKQLFGSLVRSRERSTDCPINGLFLDVLPVPPTRFRPVTRFGDNKFDNPHSMVLSSVVLDCIVLRHLLAAVKVGSSKFPQDIEPLLVKLSGKTPAEKLQSAWYALQARVNTVFDSDMEQSNRDTVAGVRQVLEKKSGLIRMHMMGKRVNYAARSVISPDPYINVDEIGVPDVFAKKLTYPQPVTPWNIKVLRQAVINGPDVHPGAVMVQNEDGSTVILSRDRIQREAVAKRLLTPSLDRFMKGFKIVYRHLQNGDVLLLNRQPTLHKPSIMAHKAVVLPGEKTLRLNYSNCKTYNADFDGDEMNAHFPQSELGRAEAYTIASVSHQYLVPKDGTPLGGLIQDHIVAAVLLMVRGKFFNREDYQQLVFGALTNKNDRVLVLRPAILRPRVMWSGKQIVSTVLINTIPVGQHLLSLNGKSKIPVKSWQKLPPRDWLAGGSPFTKTTELSESEIVIRNGEILCGILDKAHCGPTSYGLVHCCYELYGGEVSGLLLSRLGRLFTHFLQIEGFTLGVHDILVTPKADKNRSRLTKKAVTVGEAVVREALSLPTEASEVMIREAMMMAHLGRDGRLTKDIDLAMKRRTDELNNKINKVCMPDGLLKSFPDNNLQLMVISGAKGATVNCMQISCLLGQIELEGHRPPPMLSGRTLPSFLPYDPSPRAGGFVDGRFLTGIRPQEYFFHCMAGREGLIDTAVKTSRSGYLQRCLVKHLEGVAVRYDLTVRDSDESVIQFRYGEDALDVSKTPFLHALQFPFLVENSPFESVGEEIEKLKQHCDYEQVLKSNKQIRKWWRKERKLVAKGLQPVGVWSSSSSRSAAAPFVNFSAERLTKLRKKYPGMNAATNREHAKEKLMDMWYDASPDERYGFRLREPCPDPVTSTLRPDVALGAISERMDEIIESYVNESLAVASTIADESGHRRSVDKSAIRTMMHHKTLRSICEPGEAVGLLAAQSVGEPSTQMTLNTFHFAGRGEMNVTLGIPRLREILMTASKNIATPSLEVPFLSGVRRLAKKADLLRQRLTRVHLSEVLERVDVTEKIVIEPEDHARTYVVRFRLIPFESYRRSLFVNPQKILRFLETTFFEYLLAIVKKKGQLLRMSTLVSNVTMRVSVGAKESGTDKEGDREADETKATEVVKDDGDSSEDDGGGGDEDGAGAHKIRSRHNQELDLEELDEDEKNLQKEAAAESDDEGFGEPEVEEGEGTTTVSSKEEEMDREEREEGHESSLLVADEKNEKDVMEVKSNVEDLEKRRLIEERRIKRVRGIHGCIADYSYDEQNEEWCEVTIKLDLSQQRLDMTTLIEEEAKKAVVHHTPGIKRAFVVDETRADGSVVKMLKTEGVNMQEIFKYQDILDLNRLYSNDVHAVAHTYGIEAAFRVIVKEIQNVFGVYGIEVDARHLLLIADYMTFEGAYRPFSRSGMESSASPLQQMSFETTMHFLKQATIHGLPDSLKSPSSKLVVGQLVASGTGSFGVLQPLVP